ncbi:DUF4249 domain-containing protein [Chitinophaga sp. sic0106]|uniref:DUF4249 domain-containing protein n=1 Tax=Chitinophaga sp. sic0106 TaxID=2854785 RepID=UPI001C4395C3|nr:DUF4249 domain-containing protein [Chitinophaga sp. sic0106]MBV7530679.1 DUF4249 domain-containing protein [Chitinophaga sp. sic0106]
MRKRIIGLMGIILALAACEKDIDISVDAGPPLVVVEGYINNSLRSYNYVILGKSLRYDAADFANTPIEGASVTITAGTYAAGSGYTWDQSSKVRMQEVKIPELGSVRVPGVYFDPRIVTDSAHALMGVPGKSYLLEIEAAGKKYTAITSLPQPVRIDSLTNTASFKDDSGTVRARLMVHYKDPDTLGNAQLYYWKNLEAKSTFGWGAMYNDRYIPSTDDLINGQAVHITHSSRLPVGDTMQYFLVSVERPVYDFWNSFNKARINGGPFTTPVSLKSNIQGDNVVGSFSGFSISTAAHLMR